MNEYSKLSLYDDGEKRDKQVGDNLLENDEEIKNPRGECRPRWRFGKE